VVQVDLEDAMALVAVEAAGLEDVMEAHLVAVAEDSVAHHEEGALEVAAEGAVVAPCVEALVAVIVDRGHINFHIRTSFFDNHITSCHF